MRVAFSSCEISGSFLRELQLSGFIFRMEQLCVGSDGNGLPLVSVAAFANESDSMISVLISVDALGIGESQTQRLKDIAVAHFDRSGTKVIVDILATHSHSTPALISLQRCGALNDMWLNGVGDALRSALSKLSFSALRSVGRIERRLPNVSYNRRRVLRDGTVFKGVELPAGAELKKESVPPNDIMTVLTFRSHESIVGCIVHFACHPTCCNSQYCSCDYAGLLRTAVMQQLGTAVAVFVQGCAGDVNPVRFGISNPEDLRDFVSSKFAPHLGDLLSDEVLLKDASVVCLQCVPGFELNYDVKNSSCQRHVVERELQELQSASSVDGVISDGVRKRLANLMNLSSSVIETDETIQRIRFASLALAECSERTLQAISNASYLSLLMPVSVWKFGSESVIAMVGCEPFQSTQRDVRSMCRNASLLIGGYLSPCVGYMPPKDAIDAGGYEVCDAWRFYQHPFPFESDSEEKMKDMIVEMIKRE